MAWVLSLKSTPQARVATTLTREKQEGLRPSHGKFRARAQNLHKICCASTRKTFYGITTVTTSSECWSDNENKLDDVCCLTRANQETPGDFITYYWNPNHIAVKNPRILQILQSSRDDNPSSDAAFKHRRWCVVVAEWKYRSDFSSGILCNS